MLPMLEKEIVEKQKWATEDELLDYYAIGQCTPGIIAVNTATFIGYKQRKVIGSIFATLGIITPSFLIIVLLASILKRFQNNFYVLKAFKGIRIAVCALMTSSLIKLAKKAIKSYETAIIAFLALFLQLLLGLSPVLIVCFALIYAVIVFLSDKKEDKN